MNDVVRNDAPARIVDDLLHNTLDVAIALSEVEGAELGRSLVVVRVGLELLKVMTKFLTERQRSEVNERTIA